MLADCFGLAEELLSDSHSSDAIILDFPDKENLVLKNETRTRQRNRKFVGENDDTGSDTEPGKPCVKSVFEHL